MKNLINRILNIRDILGCGYYEAYKIQKAIRDRIKELEQ